MDRGRDQGVSAKILIVDDAAIGRTLLAEILRREGYEIHEADGGTAAIKMACDIRPNLILLDVCMPEMDGHTVCQKLKSQPETRLTPVIFLTASAQHGDRLQAFRGGGIDYITKPFAVPDIKRCVERHLQHPVMSGNLSQDEVPLLRVTPPIEPATLRRWRASLPVWQFLINPNEYRSNPS